MQRASSKCAHTSGISVCSPPPPPVLSSSQSTTTGGSARPSTAREVNKPYTCQQAVHMSTGSTHVNKLLHAHGCNEQGCRGRPYQPFCERRPRHKRKLQGAHRAGRAARTYQQKQRAAACGFRAYGDIHAADAAAACADAALPCCTVVPGASSHDRPSLCINTPNCVMREPQAVATGFCSAAAAGATRRQH